MFTTSRRAFSVPTQSEDCFSRRFEVGIRCCRQVTFSRDRASVSVATNSNACLGTTQVIIHGDTAEYGFTPTAREIPDDFNQPSSLRAAKAVTIISITVDATWPTSATDSRASVDAAHDKGAGWGTPAQNAE